MVGNKQVQTIAAEVLSLLLSELVVIGMLALDFFRWKWIFDNKLYRVTWQESNRKRLDFLLSNWGEGGRGYLLNELHQTAPDAVLAKN